jgi:cytochrome c5
VKQIFAVILPSLLLLSCVSTEKKSAPLPTTAMASASGTTLPTLQRGHALFISQCTRCHEAQLPATVQAKDWHTVLPGMAWNAGLKPQDERAILAYILAAKSASPGS